MADKIREAIQVALSGQNAHVIYKVALENLRAAQARERPRRGLATIWEQLGHMVFWQDIWLTRMRGQATPPVLHDSDGWPKMPPVAGQDGAWGDLVAHFHSGLKEADRFARRGRLTTKPGPKATRTLANHLLSLSTHNSYHIGQIITLRRMLGLWPPPSGGDTW